MRHWLDKGCVERCGIRISSEAMSITRDMLALSSLMGKPFCKPQAHPAEETTSSVCWLWKEEQGYGEQGTLQDICIEAAHKGHKELQPYCEMVLNSLLKWGDKFKGWLENGCSQDENDGESENVKPCPNEFMCHQMEDLVDKPFCPKPIMG